MAACVTPILCYPLSLVTLKVLFCWPIFPPQPPPDKCFQVAALKFPMQTFTRCFTVVADHCRISPLEAPQWTSFERVFPETMFQWLLWMIHRPLSSFHWNYLPHMKLSQQKLFCGCLAPLISRTFAKSNQNHLLQFESNSWKWEIVFCNDQALQDWHIFFFKAVRLFESGLRVVSGEPSTSAQTIFYSKSAITWLWCVE